ncbi:unnamed protein product [Ophioblennius macclurei]
MQTHESMVDYLSGRTSMTSFMDVFAPNFLGMNFLKPLEDDLIYSDEDDYEDDEDDEDEDDRPLGAADRPLDPHPQIKQLTDEEADKFAKELLAEEERRKDKTERNKRKKKRKKEKKRLEKETAVTENLQEEKDETKSDSSENPTDISAIIESNPEVSPPSQDDKSQNSIEAAGGDEKGDNAEKGKEMKTKEKKQDLQNSKSSSVKSVPEETNKQKPSAKQKKEKSASPNVQQPKETKPAAEKAAVQQKEEKCEVSKEKTVDSTDALAKRSREFANMGNRLAASGQYEMAVNYFTDAIKCNPKEFRLFGNRSLCYERIQQYENALRDADVALSMEPKWIKGLFRKGKALCGLKRYFEASLIYQEVLKLESTSSEASQELKRAQTLHLMELGFSWAQSSEALKTHSSLEEAVEALFISDRGAMDAGAMMEPPALQGEEEEDEDDDEGGWICHQPSRSRTQQIRESGESRSESQSPTHRPRNLVKPELFPIWVGTLSATMTYARLHELFSRTGTVYSIKMLLEQQCAFINYTRQEDCDRAIKCLHGMLVDGAPLTVRYPFKAHSELGASKSAAIDPFARPSPHKKECFFWRTTGCTRDDCTFKHVPENKNVDRERFTSGLGWNQK